MRLLPQLHKNVRCHNYCKPFWVQIDIMKNCPHCINMLSEWNLIVLVSAFFDYGLTNKSGTSTNTRRRCF